LTNFFLHLTFVSALQKKSFDEGRKENYHKFTPLCRWMSCGENSWLEAIRAFPKRKIKPQLEEQLC